MHGRGAGNVGSAHKLVAGSKRATRRAKAWAARLGYHRDFGQQAHRSGALTPQLWVVVITARAESGVLAGRAQGYRMCAPRLLAAHKAGATPAPAPAPLRPRFPLRFFF